MFTPVFIIRSFEICSRVLTSLRTARRRNCNAICRMGFWFWVLVCSFGFASVRSEVLKGTVFINGTKAIGSTDDDFVCANLDWWPPEKCSYGSCNWGHASLLNLVTYLQSLIPNSYPCSCGLVYINMIIKVSFAGSQQHNFVECCERSLHTTPLSCIHRSGDDDILVL